MKKISPRIQRESTTIAVMITLYCRVEHHFEDLCPDCRALLEYAQTRLIKCPFQEGKTTCARCPVHCFKPEMRTRVKQVMRFAGPRMTYRHPWLAIRHLVDGLRKIPARPVAKT